MRILLLLVAFAFPSTLKAQVQVNPPADWTEMETPTELPPEITFLKKIAPEDQSIQVTVTAMKPVRTTSGADEFVAGQISGMKKGGFILESVSDTEVAGFPAKHIRGEFRSDQYEGAYLADTKVIFSDQATVSVSVSIDDARGGRELGDGVLTWIEVAGAPASLSDQPTSPSKNFSIGEKIGRYTVYAAIGAALIGIVRRRIQASKTTKANPKDRFGR